MIDWFINYAQKNRNKKQERIQREQEKYDKQAMEVRRFWGEYYKCKHGKLIIEKVIHFHPASPVDHVYPVGKIICCFNLDDTCDCLFFKTKTRQFMCAKFEE